MIDDRLFSDKVDKALSLGLRTRQTSVRHVRVKDGPERVLVDDDGQEYPVLDYGLTWWPADEVMDETVVSPVWNDIVVTSCGVGRHFPRLSDAKYYAMEHLGCRWDDWTNDDDGIRQRDVHIVFLRTTRQETR